MRLFQASSDGEWDAPATYTTPSRRRPIPNFTETPSVIDPKLVSPLNADPTDAGDGDEEYVYHSTSSFNFIIISDRLVGKGKKSLTA
jgi:hypothetical protein